MPYIPAAGELKTKPTQHSVKELRSIGIQPDILLCRSDREIPKEERRKLALFCNVRETAVIEARDVTSIYKVPEAYHEAGPRFVIGFGHFVNRGDIARFDDSGFAHIAEECEFAPFFFRNFTIRTAKQNIRLDADGAQFFH